jgi:cysteine desulfurase
MGTAARLASATLESRRQRTAGFQEMIWKFVSGQIPDIHLLGPPLGPNRISNQLNLSAPGAEGEALALKLDLQGFAVAAHPPCLARSNGPSHVLQALGIPHELSRASILLTLGSDYPVGTLERFCQAYQHCVEQLRRF